MHTCASSAARLGSFEISGVWLQGARVMQHVVLYSKLQVGVWPCVSSLVRGLERILAAAASSPTHPRLILKLNGTGTPRRTAAAAAAAANSARGEAPSVAASAEETIDTARCSETSLHADMSPGRPGEQEQEQGCLSQKAIWRRRRNAPFQENSIVNKYLCKNFEGRKWEELQQRTEPTPWGARDVVSLAAATATAAADHRAVGGALSERAARAGGHVLLPDARDGTCAALLDLKRRRRKPRWAPSPSPSLRQARHSSQQSLASSPPPSFTSRQLGQVLPGAPPPCDRELAQVPTPGAANHLGNGGGAALAAAAGAAAAQESASSQQLGVLSPRGQAYEDDFED